MNPLFFQFFEILVRTTDRTEKKSAPVRIFSDQNPYHGPDQVRVRTKLRTTYRTDKNPDRKSGPRTGPTNLGPKIRTTYQNPDRSGFSVRSGRPCLYPLVTILTSDNTFGYLYLLHHYPHSEDVCATSMNQNKNLYCKTLEIWL